jgi:uncharacterized protein YbjQ (UPF0145 family)
LSRVARGIVGGRSGAYEKELRKVREIGMEELASETVGQGGSMLMVTVSGTAVKLA